MKGDPQPSGDRMCYWVPSATNPKTKYKCDLTASGGAGFCSCIDFATRRQPAIDRGEESWTRATTCRHLRSAARHFMKELLRDMAKSEETPPNQT